MADDPSAHANYVDLIRGAMPREIRVPIDQPAIHAVDWGVVLAAVVNGSRVGIPLPPPPRPEDVVTGATGHQRPHYRGLMLYCVFQARRIGPPSGDAETEGLRQWQEVLQRALNGRPWHDAPIRAVEGAATTQMAWDALALAAGDPALPTDVARRIFSRLARHQQPDGTFLRPTASDNPETFWFHELVLLHAAASYVALTGDAEVQRTVMRHTEWVQRETQPDHATSDPWGLHAFVQNPETRPTADALLHAVRVQHPHGATGVGLMLLADALYCLRPPARSVGRG